MMNLSRLTWVVLLLISQVKRVSTLLSRLTWVVKQPISQVKRDNTLSVPFNLGSICPYLPG